MEQVGATAAKEIKKFYPGYFSVVMATGVCSIGLSLVGKKQLSELLFLLNNFIYALLVALYVVRLFSYLPEVMKDFRSHFKGPGFLTFVAASSILGLEYAQVKELFLPAKLLWTVSIIGWFVLLYGFLLAAILKRRKPPLEKGINGNWLLMVVATQSLVGLSTILVSQFEVKKDLLLFASVSGWLLGIFLYVVLIGIILYRLFFFPVQASKVSPSYWIDAGAAATSVMTGIALVDAAGGSFLSDYSSAITFLCFLLWGVASWWLFLLVFLEIWRHLKVGFSYKPGYWSLVFPIGAYAIACFKLSTAVKLPFLAESAHLVVFAALGVWALVFIWMIYNFFKVFFETPAGADREWE